MYVELLEEAEHNGHEGIIKVGSQGGLEDSHAGVKGFASQTVILEEIWRSRNW